MDSGRESIGTLIVPLMVTLPLFFLIVIPLSICAGITTSLACGVLIYRAIAVYVDTAYTLVADSLSRLPGLGFLRRSRLWEQCLDLDNETVARPRRHERQPSMSPLLVRQKSPSSATLRSHRSSSSLGAQSLSTLPRPHRSSRRPNSWVVSPVADPKALVGSGCTSRVHHVDATAHISLDRDFEGLGGWRLGADDTADDNDAVWAALHSRLELPAHRRSRSKTKSLHRGYSSAASTVEADDQHSGPATPMQEAEGTITPGRASATTPTTPNASWMANVSRQRAGLQRNGDGSNSGSSSSSSSSISSDATTTTIIPANSLAHHTSGPLSMTALTKQRSLPSIGKSGRRGPV